MEDLFLTPLNVKGPKRLDARSVERETELEDVVRGIYYVTLRYRNNLQQQIELMILPPGINLLNYGWMPGVEGSVRLNYSYIYQR